MLAVGLLAQTLRAARRRDLGVSALAAGTAAWQPDKCGTPGARSLWARSFGHAAAADDSSFGSRFSSRGLWSSSVGRSSATSSNTSRGSSSSGGSAKRTRGRKTHTVEPQPQLQAWLQQEQGLTAAGADQYARRLALVFGSQHAALGGLPATFEGCRSRGLTGLQTAQLLDYIASQRQDSVVQFAALVQPVWQLIDSYVAAHIEQLRQASAKLPRHRRLAEKLGASVEYGHALVMPPGHMEAWLAAVGERLPAAAIGRLLLANPAAVSGSPASAAAVISWAADVLGVTDLAAFFARAPSLLAREMPTLQHNLDSLQQALGWTAQQARQLAGKRPRTLTSDPDTVQGAAAWLRQLFPDAEQLADVIDRGSQLLEQSQQRLQGNASTLQQALGWQDGDGQLAAFVAKYPQPFATVSLSGVATADKLRLLTRVVGVSTERCLSEGSTYLKSGLQAMAAHYMLVQARAPHLLYNDAGELHLSWINNASRPSSVTAMGISREERNTFVWEWPASEEGRRLLEGLRAGSVEGWPRPPSWEEAQQRRQVAVEEQSTAGVGGKQQRRQAAAEQQSAAGAGGKQWQRRCKHAQQ